jgi:hypothetical protein
MAARFRRTAISTRWHFQGTRPFDQIIVARSGQFAETTPFRVLHHTCGNIR